ncbi:hypothetical protein [Pseudomonas mediterranea]|nr:hypothetical protein [Pseudomonas mediterranea]MDU9026854.1 hypothetical protein [Pseudomonas mediterranea]
MAVTEEMDIYTYWHLQAIDVYVGNKEPPTSVLTHILQEYLEIPDDEAR